MVHKSGTNDPMNAAVMADDARGAVRKLEDFKRSKGLTRQQARGDIARKLRLAPGTLENVSRGRLKDPLRIEGLWKRLRAAVVAELNEEIVRLTHERDLLLATGADPRSDALAQASAAIDQARKALHGD